MTQPLALRVAAKLERCRVVHDDNTRRFAGSACRLPKVRRQNRLRTHLLITKEPIGGLQLRIIQRLGKTLAWSLGESLGQQAQSPIEPRIAEVSIGELNRERRGP